MIGERARPPGTSDGSAGAIPGAGGGLGGGHRGPLPYSDVIRQRWRRPAFRGPLPGATAVAEDVNPLCGDRVRMAFVLDDGLIAAARFVGDSCAICTASADILAEKVLARTVPDALAVTTNTLLEALDADIRPTRMRCVTLPLSVLQTALGPFAGAPAREGGP
ncbi:MAG: iron-sulfur cluster assembly scaffold protein [Candidatus Rokubacteria bacterium]|nr:iron-sulfur cluster assembly scaffold protein [Candidatus Rokubacteria bacterium]